jgi:uncharacterized membrane protein YkoI/predicted small secreted protein
MKKKLLKALSLMLAVFALVLAGCATGTTEEGSGLADIQTAEGEAVSDSGVLVLRINPELAIKYDQDGLVTDVEGRNSDGQEIIEEYSDYAGKDSGVVLEELVALIGEAGYFIDEIEGNPRQVILELESGSVLPEDEFLEKMTANVQNAASKLNVDSNVLSNEDIISLEEAKQIALEHANVNAEDAKFDDKELDRDDGNLLFELEFYADGIEYEYDIHAITGEILKVERDREDRNKAPKQETKKDQAPAETQTQQPKAEASKQEAKQTQPKQEQTQQAEYIGMERAKQIALNHAGKNSSQARWDDLEFDVDDGVPHYEIEFDVGPNEYDYDIHAVSGKIIEFDHEIKGTQNKTNTNEVPAEKQPSVSQEISKDEAINIALNHAGLSRSQVAFDDVELDYEDGRKEWEIEFDHGNWEYEYEIDASNGNILDFEREYDD